MQKSPPWKSTLFLYLFKNTRDSRVFFTLIKCMKYSEDDTLIERNWVNSDAQGSISSQRGEELSIVAHLLFEGSE